MITSRSRAFVPALCATLVVGLTFATGCGDKPDDQSGAAIGTPPATATGSASVTAGGAPAPGNPNPNAAANAAAFEAARKKAEGK